MRSGEIGAYSPHLYRRPGPGRGGRGKEPPGNGGRAHLAAPPGGFPLTRAAAPYFAGNVSLVLTDSTLGVPGLPQSATGQTAILTGRNGAKVLGRHHNAYPPQPLRELIARDSILKRVVDRGYTATFANAFTPEYFRLVAEGKRRHSVTTEVTLAAGLPLRQLEDLQGGRRSTRISPMGACGNGDTMSPSLHRRRRGPSWPT